MDSLTIGKVARRAGVNVETVRYYQRRGLLAEPPRPPGGIRRYGAEAVRRIRFIRRAQELGFALAETGELLAMQVEAETSCDEVRERVEEKIGDIRRRIRDLRRMEGVLARLAESCRRRSPTGPCPILAALEE